MKKTTAEFLHEARTACETVEAHYTAVNSMTAVNAVALFTGAELAVKSPIAEKFGSVPKGYRTHDLVDYTKTIGLWDELPPHLQNCLSRIGRFDPDTRYPGQPAHETLVNSTMPGEWPGLISHTRELIDFMEQHLENPARFGKLRL